MHERLDNELEKVLVNIANKGNTPMLIGNIRALVKLSYITAKFGGGWMLNSKGRQYLKQHKIKI